jgi:TfoX/Sxy family transcriptional regulator of competence genes
VKPTPELVAQFEEVAEGYPEVDRKAMFGCPCLWVNGQLAGGVHARGWFLRLPEAAREEALALPGSGRFGHEDRPMNEYVVLPAAVSDDAEALAGWLERSFAYVAALPPKPERARRARRPRA